MTPADLDILEQAGLLVQLSPGVYRIASGAECLLQDAPPRPQPTPQNRPHWAYDPEEWEYDYG